MTDRLAELGALRYAAENTATHATSPNRLAAAGYIHAAFAEYQTWAAANPGINPSRLSAKGRLFGYFYDNATFSPLSLFAASEQGVWYDPSDLSTMFQNRLGIVTGTAVGQPVGLILDKSKAPTSRTVLPVMTCSATVSQAGNVLTFAASPADAQASGNPPINVNYFYRMSFTIVGTGSVYVYVGASPVVFSAGTHTLKPWTAGLATYFIFRANVGGFNGTVTFTELIEYAGNHASQATAAAKPILRQDGGGKYYLEFDGVDDALVTTFPASLGSSCTVCRANVGVAPTILTGQTIGTSYTDSTDHAGLIIINRALTGQETTDVTAWLLAKGATA